ncbi:hypothetical protein JANAI62_37060 [Jannaschia pagri]|uniref:Ca2+-binding protein, RTX toxin-related n=1 Tax=Jannaschia pagri TaxID=2829797 RepID=A0ABQ4NRU3_9RHOB|nr:MULTISPECIES: calcium-binding protein [unclassified Jannaschia]GIT93250.1 hypothetical protein JANAI61_37080 [Jannaschia sp. AI_61]GIT97083.1 hypothetical protein JANAI62_37060 [Jannaschia sp. AI_62]
MARSLGAPIRLDQQGPDATQALVSAGLQDGSVVLGWLTQAGLRVQDVAPFDLPSATGAFTAAPGARTPNAGLLSAEWIGLDAIGQDAIALAWYEDDDVFDGPITGRVVTQVFNRDGTALTDPVVVVADRQVDDVEVTALGSDRYAVAYGSFVSADDASSPFRRDVQIFDGRTAQPIGDPIRLGSSGGDVSVAMTAADTFTAIWEFGNGLAGQSFLSDGTPVGDSFAYLLPEGIGAAEVSVTDLPNAGFAVAWSQDEGQGADSAYSLVLQRFDATGVAVGPLTTLTDVPQTSFFDHALTALEDGTIIAAWEDRAFGRPTDVVARVVAADGTLGQDILLAGEVTEGQGVPAVTAIDGRNALVSWVEVTDSFFFAGEVTAAIVNTDPSTPAVTEAEVARDLRDALVEAQAVDTENVTQVIDYAGLVADGGERVGKALRSISIANAMQELSTFGAISAELRQDVRISPFFLSELGDVGFDNLALRNADLVNKVTTLFGKLDRALPVVGAAVEYELNTRVDGPDQGDLVELADTLVSELVGRAAGGVAAIVAGGLIITLGGPAILVGAVAGGTALAVSYFTTEALDEGNAFQPFFERVFNDGAPGVPYNLSNPADGLLQVPGGIMQFQQASMFFASAPVFEPTGSALTWDSETEIQGGMGPDTIQGGALDNTINGAGGDDSLLGGPGNDTLDGGAGGDRLEGGIGDDVYIIDDLRDRVFEDPGGGFDEVRTSVDFSAGQQEVERLVALGTDDIRLVGTSVANTLIGNAGSNVLIGGGGQDTMQGGAGADVFVLLGRDSRIEIQDFGPGDRLAIDDRLLGLGEASTSPRALTQETALALLREGRAGFDGRTGTLLLDTDGSGPGGLKPVVSLGGSIAVDDILIF